MSLFGNRRNRKELPGVPEVEVVTFADLDGWIDLPTEEALAADLADRRRDTVAPRSES